MKTLLLKNSVTALAISIMILTPAYAANPTECPSVHALQSAKFMRVEQEEDGSYDVTSYWDKFETNMNWMFGFYPIQASSIDDAKQKARAALASLSLASGPTEGEDKYWICQYKTSMNFDAAAITAGNNNFIKFHLTK